MKMKAAFAVGYMFVVTAVFSFLIIGVARSTQQRVDANQRLSMEKAVLNVFPGITYSSDAEAHKIFEEKFQQPSDAGGAWVYMKDDTVAGYAVPISGKGFWATIKGIVGIGPDRQTVTGISFYQQSETPGLGARITEPFFRDQFQGLKLGAPGQPIGMRSPGSELSPGQVHAISGATQTCIRLEKLMNDDLREWMQKMSGKEATP